jgi:anthranilate phosphoribosyltransferase
MLPLVAEVLARRGVRAMVFRGDDGLDELTTTGPSTVYHTREGAVSARTFDPSDLGFARAAPEDLGGGDVHTNAEIARRVLGGELGPRRDVVVLNAAAALEVAGRTSDPAEGIELASTSIDSGAAARTLERWIEVSHAAG